MASAYMGRASLDLRVFEMHFGFWVAFWVERKVEGEVDGWEEEEGKEGVEPMVSVRARIFLCVHARSS